MTSWDKYFFELCKVIASKSKDPSTKVGALIVGKDNEIRSTGWNGFARGVIDNEERYNNREIKYPLVVHAEMNAICNAARVGTPLDGCSLYVYPLFVCNECAKSIIQVGIKNVFIYSTLLSNTTILSDHIKAWITKMEITEVMFNEAKINFKIFTDGDLL